MSAVRVASTPEGTLIEHVVGICRVFQGRKLLGSATYDLTVDTGAPDEPPTVHGKLTPRGWDARTFLREPLVISLQDDGDRRFEVTSNGWNKTTKVALVAGSQIR